jgi:hypothetical protein
MQLIKIFVVMLDIAKSKQLLESAPNNRFVMKLRRE